MVSFYVDFETQERHPKKSVYWHKKVKENSSEYQLELFFSSSFYFSFKRISSSAPNS